MRPNTDQPLTRSLNAAAVATALALSLRSDYADEAKQDEGAKRTTQEQTQPTERETLAQHQDWEDPNMERIAVHACRALLRHVRAADAALEEDKVGEARSAQNAAEEFTDGPQLRIPYTVVVDSRKQTR
jgi:hypothetical protein